MSRPVFGFIHRATEWFIPPQYFNAEPFFNGLAHVRTTDTDCYVDYTGQVVLSQPWEPKTGLGWEGAGDSSE